MQPSLTGAVYTALDEFAAMSMAAASTPPMAVGAEGSMFASGVANYVKGMLATTQAALSSEVGLAGIREQFRQAELSAAVERERIKAQLEAAAMEAEAQEHAAHESASAQRYSASLRYDIAQQQLGLQSRALDVYSAALKSANSIENLAYGLAGKSFSGTPSHSTPQLSRPTGIQLTDTKTGTTITAKGKQMQIQAKRKTTKAKAKTKAKTTAKTGGVH